MDKTENEKPPGANRRRALDDITRLRRVNVFAHDTPTSTGVSTLVMTFYPPFINYLTIERGGYGAKV